MKTPDPVIVKCGIALPKTDGKWNLGSNATSESNIDNGDAKLLFEFYPDEITFKEFEFIGLTEESARRLKFEKDKRHIQFLILPE